VVTLWYDVLSEREHLLCIALLVWADPIHISGEVNQLTHWIAQASVSHPHSHYDYYYLQPLVLAASTFSGFGHPYISELRLSWLVRILRAVLTRKTYSAEILLWLYHQVHLWISEPGLPCF